MNRPILNLSPPDAEAFAPYGEFVLPPGAPKSRRFYSDHLEEHADGSAPVLHMNHVAPSQLPLQFDQIERHPYAAQCFFPADVSRYLVVVMPSDPSGAPLTDQALAFLLPGTIGVIYRPKVWHLGATVLDRPGHFAVLMWRGGGQDDDEYQDIPALTLMDTNASEPGVIRRAQSN